MDQETPSTTSSQSAQYVLFVRYSVENAGCLSHEKSRRHLQIQRTLARNIDAIVTHYCVMYSKS